MMLCFLNGIFVMHDHRVKIGICGLHYHPSNPFMAFFSDPYSPFEIFNFLLHYFISFFAIHLWIMLRVGTVHMSSTRIYKLLNAHPEARKCLTNIARENDQNFETPGIVWLFTQE